MKEDSEPLSMNPMNFGSEEDYKLTLTELGWIAKTYGKVTKRDLENVSSKYNFPIDFIKHGFKGLKSPDDYRISKSKWFPILYSWIVQKREKSFRLFCLQIDYERAKFSIFRNLAILIGITQLIIIMMWNYELLDMLNLSLLVLSFVLFFIGLFFEMHDPLSAKKMRLEEYSHLLKQRGLGKIIEDNERFLRNHSRVVRYAGNILKKKIEEGISMTIFAAHVENGTLVVDDGEFPDREYLRRISELAKVDLA